MKKFLPALALSALFGTQTASAQQMRASLKDSLQKASDRLFEKGYDDFITVDAVKDGLLQFNQPYAYTYRNQQLTFTHIKISADQNLQYTKKLQACLDKRGKHDDISISLVSEGVTMQDIFDTTSSMWRSRNPPSAMSTPVRSDSAAHLKDMILLGMLDDNLIRENEEVDIICTQKSIWLNGKYLQDPYAKKYINMLQQVNETGQIRIETIVNRNKLRYPQPGPEVKDK